MQHTDGAVLSDSIGHFVGIHPECEFAGEKPEQLLAAQSNPLRRLSNQRIHFMVDANATVTRPLARLFWEPVMFIMFCQQLLQALAEGLQLSLTREPLGAEELGDEGHGGGDLAYHGGGPGVEGMHGGGGAGGAAPRAPSQVGGLRGREGGRGGRLLFFFQIGRAHV